MTFYIIFHTKLWQSFHFVHHKFHDITQSWDSFLWIIFSLSSFLTIIWRSSGGDTREPVLENCTRQNKSDLLEVFILWNTQFLILTQKLHFWIPKKNKYLCQIKAVKDRLLSNRVWQKQTRIQFRLFSLKFLYVHHMYVYIICKNSVHQWQTVSSFYSCMSEFLFLLLIVVSDNKILKLCNAWLHNVLLTH